jgi:hypothetical protein
VLCSQSCKCPGFALSVFERLNFVEVVYSFKSLMSWNCLRKLVL